MLVKIKNSSLLVFFVKFTILLSREGGRSTPSPLSSRKMRSISTMPFGSMIWNALTRISFSSEYRQLSHTIEGRREGSFRILHNEAKLKRPNSFSVSETLLVRKAMELHQWSWKKRNKNSSDKIIRNTNGQEICVYTNCYNPTVYSFIIESWRTSFEGRTTHFGESSPVSSSPRTPCLSTVSSMPAVWYLRENAFSLGKNPICRLITMDI